MDKKFKIMAPDNVLFILLKKNGKEMFRRSVALDRIGITETDQVKLYLRVTQEVFDKLV